MNIREAVRQELLVPILVLLVTAFLPMHVWAQAEPTLTVPVNCAAGRTIAHALRQGDERKPLVVIVQGTCTENVTVDRDDVTLVAGGAGGTVNGPDPNTSTITVTGSRVTIDGLTVTGGRNGILGVGARAMTIANCIVQNTGRTGIVFFQGTAARWIRVPFKTTRWMVSPSNPQAPRSLTAPFLKMRAQGLVPSTAAVGGSAWTI